MSETWDAIVIGSGFGGSVVACRLAERGMKVLVLERGRRWAPEDYPRKPGDPWFYSVRHPERRHGWLDLRCFTRMMVAQAAGVGGGSLAYSSVAVEAHPSCFDEGWPPELSHAELKPHYDTVARMMRLQPIPDGQLTARLVLTRDAAQRLGHGDRFSKLPLAVSFSPDWHDGLDQPFDRRHSKTFVNEQGRQQGTCIHLGTCDIGCDVRAKNGLDLNYLALAERHGCEVRPLHVVRGLAPIAGGYRVAFDRIVQGQLAPGEAVATRVFLAAGSLGSTELLLRARDEQGTLPKLSRALGHRWSPNANVLSMAAYPDAERVRQSVGPTITAAVDFMDGATTGERFVVEDDGFPNLLLNAWRAATEDGEGGRQGSAMPDTLAASLRGGDLRGLMLWLGAGVDAGDGEIRLGRRRLPPRLRSLDLRWSGRRSRRVIDGIVAMHRRMTESTGGDFRTDPGWEVFGRLLTLHPLGGCRMAATPEVGVVDHVGRVFGYPNLHVVDGSIVPVPLGRNPSHTIAALAERAVAAVT